MGVVYPSEKLVISMCNTNTYTVALQWYLFPSSH